MRKLTAEQIDALEGIELSYHVGCAMGKDIEYDDVLGAYYGGDCTDPDAWYQPHADANQALEVWAAMPSDDKVVEMWMPDDVEACCYIGYTRIRCYGDFCTAICRAFLKARACTT